MVTLLETSWKPFGMGILSARSRLNIPGVPPQPDQGLHRSVPPPPTCDVFRMQPTSQPNLKNVLWTKRPPISHKNRGFAGARGLGCWICSSFRRPARAAALPRVLARTAGTAPATRSSCKGEFYVLRPLGQMGPLVYSPNNMPPWERTRPPSWNPPSWDAILSGLGVSDFLVAGT